MGTCTLKGSAIDLAKMKTARECIEALKVELCRIKEMGESSGISENVRALNKILQGAEKLVCGIFLLYSVIINGAQESGFLKHYI
jgi:hypothetical protein